MLLAQVNPKSLGSNGMPSAVVFDTNAYQGLSRDLVQPLIAAESKDDILGHADCWVLIELFGKLVDPPTRGPARGAIRKLWHHCGAESLRMIVDCEEQVCRILLGRSPIGHDAVRDRLRNLCGEVATAAPDYDMAPVLAAATELRAHLDVTERGRSDLILNGIVRSVMGKAASWNGIASDREVRQQVLDWIDAGEAVRALAASEVRRAHVDLDLPIPDPLPEEMMDLVLTHFRYPLEVESTMIRAVVERGWDLTINGRQNAIWDAQIAFNAGQTVAGGRRIVLVTDDNLLLDVATRVAEPHVQSRAAYMSARNVAA